MRFMMLLKADKRTEAGELPTRDDLETMGRYNAELMKAGVLIEGVGLQPTSRSARIRFRNGQVEVIDGPFAETKELIAGYWMIQVNSKEEAVEWARRAPAGLLPAHEGVAEIELRQVFELSDFPDVPPQVAEMEEALAGSRAGRGK